MTTTPTSQPTRVFDLLDTCIPRFHRRPLFRYGKDELTAEAYRTSAQALSLCLLEDGLERGEAVALISANRPEWNIAEMAVLQAGGWVLPLCVGLTAEDYVDALQSASVRILLVENEEMLNRFRLLLPQVERLRTVLMLDALDSIISTMKKKKGRREWEAQLEMRSRLITTDDVCCLHYTGGSTFRRLTHRELLEQAEAQCANESLRRRAAAGNNALCTTYGRIRNYACQLCGRTVNYPLPV